MEFQINGTIFDPEKRFPAPFAIPSPPSSSDFDELKLRELARIYGDHTLAENISVTYPQFNQGFAENEHDYGNVFYGRGSARIYPGREMLDDSLVESLAHFLGSPERNWEIGEHQISGEIDFGDIRELNAVRQMGKEANIPQNLVDSVDPEADENLLELMVRIAENPVKWRNIHSAIQRVDQNFFRNDKAKGKSFERKEVEKRSSSLDNRENFHPGPKGASRMKKKKLAKLNKKKKKKHFLGREWDEEGLYQASESDEIAALTVNGGAEQKIGNDGSYDSGYFNDERYAESVHRKSSHRQPSTDVFDRDGRKQESVAYASVVFGDNENKNFERWKVSYQPVEPNDVDRGVPKDYKHLHPSGHSSSKPDRFAKKKFKMSKTLAKIHATKEVKPSRIKEKAAADLRQWQLLKFNQKMMDKWSRVKELQASHELNGGDHHEKNGERQKEMRTPLPTKWVTSKKQKAENWPHFAYHRVTSSPSVQQRDAGTQPRHRSAYVAVSVVPTNSTGVLEEKHDNERLQELRAKEAHSIGAWMKRDTPPHLFDPILKEHETDQDNFKLLKNVELRFGAANGDAIRVEELVREGTESNITT